MKMLLHTGAYNGLGKIKKKRQSYAEVYRSMFLHCGYQLWVLYGAWGKVT
jgi:hypothetical protein